MNFSIQPYGTYVEIKISGPADHRVYSELLDSILTRDAWQEGTPVLLDQTEMDTEHLSVVDMKSLADLCGIKIPETITDKLALLIPSDYEFAMSRMWASLVASQWNVPVKLFRSRNDALSWLTD